MAIVLIAIGLLFTGVDFMVGSGISYPDFIQPTGLYHGIDIHPRIQQYVTQIYRWTYCLTLLVVYLC